MSKGIRRLSVQRKPIAAYTAIPASSGGSGGGGGGGTTIAGVRVVATSNLSLTGAATIDGVAVATADRVLVTAQSTGSQNGIYAANTAGAWTRVTDFASAGQMITGAIVPVYAGTVYTGTTWIFTTTGAITVGTTALTFTQNPGGGALAGQTASQAALTLFPQSFATVVGASVQTMTLSNLADDDYDIYISIVNGHAGAAFTLHPNSSGSNLAAFGLDILGGNARGSDWPLFTNASFLGGVGAGVTLTGQGTLRGKSGLARFWNWNAYLNSATSNITQVWGIWTDTATALSSLQVASNQTDGIAAGSFILATQRRRS